MVPHEAEVFLDDIESQSIPAPQWRRQMALLPAESQWWCETVGDHFHHFDAILFNSLGFQEEVMDWQISHLSSGERQRLACIRVLINKPRALLLDEPTANLDKSNRNKVEVIIAEYQSRYQVPVLWINHDQEQLARVSQYLLTLNQGEYEVTQTGIRQSNDNQSIDEETGGVML